ncbi:MAG: hypothetical protein ABWZ99_13340 [Ilumatobacteraceae bacterium]
MDAARTIGIDVTNGDVSGTIDEAKVLTALTALAQLDPAHADLFDDVAARVRLARSAGAEGPLTSGARLQAGDAAPTQLRYRSEMADLFLDLAIDVGLRRDKLVPAA